eukprot:3709473-Rhodomonas_salina.2
MPLALPMAEKSKQNAAHGPDQAGSRADYGLSSTVAGHAVTAVTFTGTAAFSLAKFGSRFVPTTSTRTSRSRRDRDGVRLCSPGPGPVLVPV